MTVRHSGPLSEFVAANVSEHGAYENVSEYVRDLIRCDKDAKEAAAFERLKAELTSPYTVPETSYRPPGGCRCDCTQSDLMGVSTVHIRVQEAASNWFDEIYRFIRIGYEAYIRAGAICTQVKATIAEDGTDYGYYWDCSARRLYSDLVCL